MIYAALQNIAYKRYRKKKIQNNTAALANPKSCQYSLRGRLNEKKKVRGQSYWKLWQTNGIKAYKKLPPNLFEFRIYLIEVSTELVKRSKELQR